MKKNEVAAYLIMESTMDPVKPQNLQVYDKNNLFYVKFDTNLQQFDVFNRNKRSYGGKPMEESLRAPHISELMQKKTWMGEAGHPHTEQVARILTIDPKLTSHRINNYRIEGSMLKGEVETLDNGIYGTQMTKSILQGMEPAFSLRALASLIKQGDGSSLMRSKAHIVTYDWVILPSHSNAYRDQSKPIQKIEQSVRSSGNILTESSVWTPVVESQIADFIQMESANVKLISNVCEVAMESMSLSSDLSHVILREGSNKYAVKIEDKIKHDVRNFMMHL